MKITQDVRAYAEAQGLEADQALTRGMEDMAEAFKRTGSEIYTRS